MERKLGKFAYVVFVGLLTLSLAGCGEERDGDSDGHGKKVTLEQVPAAVKATIEKESKSGMLKEIDELNQDGKRIYGAEIVLNGRETQTFIAEDGTVLKSQVTEKDDD